MKSIQWLFSIWPFFSLGQVTNEFEIGSLTNRIEFQENRWEMSSSNNYGYEAKPYDIIISEIMPDPTPAVLLPEYEYVELFNQTAHTISIDGWSFEAGTRRYLLSGNIHPRSYLILTYTGATGLFVQYAQVSGVFTAVAALANTGQTLVLKDRNEQIIDAVQYSDKWYGDPFKAQGGWSLERIDLANGCAGSENWKSSHSFTGGTPGKENSVNTNNPDFDNPFVSSVRLISDKEVNLVFNESIDRSFFNEHNPFILLNSSNLITEVIPALPFYNSCRLILLNSIIDGKTYELMISENFRDCSGNRRKDPYIIRFGKPELPGFTDVIITEVLYSPFPGCPEFIEIYCNSDKILDLSGLTIGINDGNTQPVKREYIINEQQLFFPGQYLVLSKVPEALINYYDILFPSNLMTVKNLPSLRNDRGCIELTDRSLEVIDRYCYSNSDQFPLLNSNQGVSLERMNIDRKPGYQSHWHSASSVAGFATPGYKNSQSYDVVTSDETIKAEPRTFTPDNDGLDDVVIITYSIPVEGYTGNIIIFDASGRQVKHLAKNELLGFQGNFLWDGRDDMGMLCRTGIYLVFFDAYNLRGERIRKKRTVVLVRR